jgi:hypothetical protein
LQTVPGENFSRRVARAAAAGGGRTYRAQTPVSWYLIVFVICLLGVSLVAYSRYEVLHPLPSIAAKSVPPTATNEWEAAVAVDACGTFVPSALPVEAVPNEPIASLGNGVVRIEPGLSSQASQFEGAKATLGNYLGLEAAEITPTIMSFPGPLVPVPTTTTTSTTVAKSTAKSSTTTTATTTSTTVAKSTGKAATTTSSSSTSSTSSTTTTTAPTTKAGPPRVYKTGQTKCDGKPGVISVETWSSPKTTKGLLFTAAKAPGIRFANGQLITIAFLPKGAVIPRPPAAARTIVATFLVEDPSGFATPTVASTAPIVSTSATTPTTTAGASTTSSAAASTSSTVAGSTSSTTKPTSSP